VRLLPAGIAEALAIEILVRTATAAAAADLAALLGRVHVEVGDHGQLRSVEHTIAHVASEGAAVSPRCSDPAVAPLLPRLEQVGELLSGKAVPVGHHDGREQPDDFAVRAICSWNLRRVHGVAGLRIPLCVRHVSCPLRRSICTQEYSE
jgi:hypothetical protein